MSLERNAASTAIAVWVVVAGLFGATLAFHLRVLGHQYQHIVVPPRPQESNAQNLASIHPGRRVGVEITTFAGFGSQDGTKGMVFGQSLDQPLRVFAGGFNEHIDELNASQRSDNWIAILLDLIGLVTALFSAFYEWTKVSS